MLHCANSEVVGMSRGTPRTDLTGIELQVIRWLPSELSYADIGQQLGLSGAMVRVVAIGVFRKLGVDGRRDAVVLSVRLGLLRPVAVVDRDDPDD
jgi:LuxR family maltose regulon positive regulatory protein